MDTKYSIVENNARHWASYDQRLLGAVACSRLKTYAYPFFTPNGVNVLQECPPDHSHHQGIMVGQDFVNGHNFWAINHASYPKNYQTLEGMESSSDESGVTVVQSNRWHTLDGQAVLQEQRRTRFEAWEGLNFVDVLTTWKAAYGDVYFGRTKEGGLGMRLDPQLETFWGGTILSSEGKKGEGEVFDSLADWIEVSGIVSGRDVGIVMMPHPSQNQIPWFARDYGIHLFGPLRHAPMSLAAGREFSLRVGFATYDGKSDGSQGARAWRQYQSRK